MKSNGVEPMVVSIREAATSLGVSCGTVRNLVSDGSLRSIRVRDRRLILKADLLAFVEQAAMAA
jgi:excisionase family DNA binding protein